MFHKMGMLHLHFGVWGWGRAEVEGGVPHDTFGYDQHRVPNRQPSGEKKKRIAHFSAQIFNTIDVK